MSTITVPQGFGYVPPAALFLLGVLVWQTSRVGRSRGKAGIKYPQVYADAAQQAASKEAMVFNCAQRAHQNTLEALPIVLTTTAITALQYPIVAAGGLGVWAFSRIFYTLGYMTGQPEKRRRGFFGYFGMFALLGGSVATSYNLITAGI